MTPQSRHLTTCRLQRAQRRILAVTMFCYLFYYTGRQTFGFAIPGIEQELGISKSTLGWASAVMLWAYALGQSINGNLADKFGGRYLMSGGAVLSCALNWIVSFGTNATTLLVPWALNGYAQSMGWAPGSRVLSNWWEPSKRGRVYGCYVLAAGMSSVLAFCTSSLILELQLGWRSIFRYPVLLLLVGGALYYLLVRDRPADLGLVGWRDQEAERTGEAVASRGATDSVTRYIEVLSNGRFLIACVAIGFQNWARYGLLIWVPVYFLGEDWRTSETKWVSIALPVGMAAGAILSGWTSDRFFNGNRSRVIVAFLTLASLCSLTMYGLPREHGLGIPMLFLTGFFAYGPQAAFWALCPDLLGTERAGTGTGVMNTFAYVFAGLGEPLIGQMIDVGGDASIVFAVVAGTCAAGAVIALAIGR